MNRKTVSFSQLSMYNECHRKWYLNYVLGLSKYEVNIHLTFGSAMHSVMQSFLKKMYTTTATEAEDMDLNSMLKDELSKEFTEAKAQMNGVNPATKEEMVEFYEDGVQILNFFKRHRGDYFNKKGYSLVGIEIPLQKDLQNNTTFKGYIDVVIKDEISNKVKIIDFKTSTNGWKDYAKKDQNKTAQILLYKKFYSDMFNIPVDKIDVEFIILKRKLYENVDFPQKRLQKFSPASGTVSIGHTVDMLNEFINACFTSTGDYNTSAIYKKTDTAKKCSWCEHLGKNCSGAGKED